MGLGKLVTAQILKRTSGGKIKKTGRIQALMRIPVLLRVALPLFKDSRVPAWQRAGVLGLLALIFSPLDFIGDIPVIGQFWDLSLAVVVLEYFLQWAPADVVNEHIRAHGLEDKIPLRTL